MWMALQATELKPGKARWMRWLRKPIAPLCREEQTRLLEIQYQFTNRDTPICEVEVQRMLHKNHCKMHRPNAPKEQIITTDPKPSLPNQEPNRPDPTKTKNSSNELIATSNEMVQDDRLRCARRENQNLTVDGAMINHGDAAAHKAESQKPNRERKDEIGELYVPAWDKKKKEDQLLKRRRRKLRRRYQRPAHKVPWPPQSSAPPLQAKGKNPQAVRLLAQWQVGPPFFFSFLFHFFFSLIEKLLNGPQITTISSQLQWQSPKTNLPKLWEATTGQLLASARWKRLPAFLKTATESRPFGTAFRPEAVPNSPKSRVLTGVTLSLNLQSKAHQWGISELFLSKPLLPNLPISHKFTVSCPERTFFWSDFESI